jgi:hypothetical protein
MSRQQTPDIMANLMNGTALIDGEQEKNKAIKPVYNKEADLPKESNKTINIPKNKAIEQDSGKGKIEMKEKATFNLSLSTLETLEDAWIQLKRQFKGEQRITKTAIVELAIEICVKEFEAKKQESMLYKKLVDLRDDARINDDSTA